MRPRHREVIAPDHRGRGREVRSCDGTSAHHDRGSAIWGVHRAWDYVETRYGLSQTVVTAVMAHRHLIDGIAINQGLMMALTAFGPALVMAFLIYDVMREATLLPIFMTGERIAYVFAATLAMSTASAFLSLRAVRRADPVDLF